MLKKTLVEIYDIMKIKRQGDINSDFDSIIFKT